MKSIKNTDLSGKVVLLRTDYNVPIFYAENGEASISNDFRIRASLPTLKFLIESGVKKIIIISHMGRPNSVENLADLDELEKLSNGMRKFSLRPVFNRLKQLLAEEFEYDFPMNFHSTPIFSRTNYSVPIGQANDDYKIEMLENLRFCKGEKKNSTEFAEALARIAGADIFVQDGFGVVHRAHASTSEITKKLPSFAGLLLEKEVSTITGVFENPERPFVAVLGGVKISDKLPLIEKIVEKADKILVTGAMANTFLKYHGAEIGRSKFEDGQFYEIENIENIARRKFGLSFRENLILPSDLAVAREFLPDAERIEVKTSQVSPKDFILDIGQNSISNAENTLKNAKTIIWNGTAGYAEFENFANGSSKIAESISKATKNGAVSVVGGGDTSAFVLDWMNKNPDLAEFSLISTGGGAALELMSGEELPGIEAVK